MSFSRRTLAACLPVCASLFLLAGPASAQAAVEITSPADGAYVNAARPAVAFTGALPGGTITLESDGELVGETVADDDGNGAITPTADIADHPTPILDLTVRDEDGMASVLVHYNTVPSLSGPADGTTHPASDISFDVASAIPDEDVVLFDGDAVVAVTTADAEGAASGLAPEVPLTAGPHALSARTIDADGVASNPETVDIDVEPEAPAFAEGIFDGMQLNQSESPLAVTDVDPDADQVTVYEIVDGDAIEVASSTDIASDGTATVTPTLDDGRHTLGVQQTVNGVESSSYQLVTVGVITSAPTLEEPEVDTASPWFTAYGLLVNGGEVVLYVDGEEAGRDSGFGGDVTTFQATEPLTEGDHTAYVVIFKENSTEFSPDFGKQNCLKKYPTLDKTRLGEIWRIYLENG